MREATVEGGLLEGGSFLRPGSHLRAGNRVARNVQLFVGHSDLPPPPQSSGQGTHVLLAETVSAGIG